MTDSAPLDRMQKIADYRTTCKFLNQSGKQGIIFGFIFLFNGVMNFDNRPLDYLYLGLGAVELFVGLFNRYRPSAIGIILDGITLILLGVWNLTWLAINGGLVFNAWFSGVFGAVVIILGVQRIRRFSRVKAAFEELPNEEQMAWFDDIVKEVREAIPDAAGDVVEFRAGFVWKGKRFGDMAIFVDKMDLENLIVDRRDINWTDKGKALFSSKRNIRLRIGERSFIQAETTPEMLSLLEAWRQDKESPETDDAYESSEKN